MKADIIFKNVNYLDVKEMKKATKIEKEGIDPFMTLSFTSLAVIGDIRLLPSGVFDVRKWSFVK